MFNNNELVNMLRAVIQDELKPVRQELEELRQDVQWLKKGQAKLEAGQAKLEAGQAKLEAGQAKLEAAINDLRTINRRTHKEIFSQLNAIWNDIKLLSSQREKAVR